MEYAQDEGLRVFVGTVNDPELINWLMHQGINGIVPDNPVDFEMAGLKRPAYERKIELNETSVTELVKNRAEKQE